MKEFICGLEMDGVCDGVCFDGVRFAVWIRMSVLLQTSGEKHRMLERKMDLQETY